MDIYYFHYDMTDPAYPGIVTGISAVFATVLPNNILSINENNTGTESLIKLVAPEGWIDTPAANFAKQTPALIRIYTPDDHNEALNMVKNVAWTG
jgi:hypothetical protein